MQPINICKALQDAIDSFQGSNIYLRENHKIIYKKWDKNILLHLGIKENFSILHSFFKEDW